MAQEVQKLASQLEGMKKKEQDLKQMEQELSTREQKLSQNDQDLRSREEPLNQREAKTSQREEEVRKKEQAVKQQEQESKQVMALEKTKLTKREEEVRQKEKAAQAIQDALEEEKLKVSEKDKQLSSREATLRQKEVKVLQKEEEVRKKEQAVKQQEQESKQVMALLSKREEEVGEKEKAVQATQDELKERTESLKEQQDILKRERSQLEEEKLKEEQKRAARAEKKEKKRQEEEEKKRKEAEEKRIKQALVDMRRGRVLEVLRRLDKEQELFSAVVLRAREEKNLNDDSLWHQPREKDPTPSLWSSDSSYFLALLCSSDSSYSNLAEFLKKSTTVSTKDPTSLIALPLLQQTSLSLDCSDTELDRASLAHVARFLAMNQLTTFELNTRDPGDAVVVEQLADCLAKQSVLRTFRLNFAKGANLQYLVLNGLIPNRSLTTVRLGELQRLLGRLVWYVDMDLKLLGKLLAENKTIKALEVRGRVGEVEELNDFGRGLSQNRSLTSLTIDFDVSSLSRLIDPGDFKSGCIEFNGSLKLDLGYSRDIRPISDFIAQERRKNGKKDKK